MKQPMFNVGLMLAARAAVAKLFATGAIKATPVVGRSTWAGLGPPRSSLETRAGNYELPHQSERECMRRVRQRLDGTIK